MALRTVQFIAALLAGIALIPAGAHLFALPNKIGLAPEPYFIVQNIYRGWALFGIVWFGALIATAVLAFMLRGQSLPCAFAAIAALCIVAMLIVFFVWTFPANQATGNWTVMPANWETLRRDWEYSHAVNAVLALAAFCSLVLSILTGPSPSGGEASH